GEADPRAEGTQALGGLVQRVDPIVEEEDLAPPLLLAEDRPLHQVLVVWADVGPDGPASLRRSFDDRDVTEAGERHLQRPRDRGGREREYVDLELELPQQLLLLHAESLLLVDDEQPEVLAPHVTGEQAVRSDQDVDPALPEALERVPHLRGPPQAGDHLDVERG